MISLPGPSGPLRGAALLPENPRAAVVIIPGSGPTDRDGNSPQGLSSDTYRLLAEALEARGIGSVRIDKRGMFGSAGALEDAEAATIAGYAEDAVAWAGALAGRTGQSCAWLAGHSEGGLVALAAVSGARSGPVCGVILLATPGRPLAALLREQLQANPENAPYLDQLDRAVTVLERGAMVDPETISPVLRPLFRAGLQRYMIQLFAYDPAVLARAVQVPALIVQGGRDQQVRPVDADTLARAMPHAGRLDLPQMTHMLKADQPDQPFATYTDRSLPLVPEVAATISDFILTRND
ncbi:alpha/beta hydrolase [Pseudodonghicola xiamenensis]|uniref:alpha/beta hydrolase n=1 Tax=Pseudodonghicola xiamenensis TaxID=337702 RepID=UPI001F0A6E06|nr:alpha/beta fold hydrolase [Pseudodonghicola xiamenensis]